MVDLCKNLSLLPIDHILFSEEAKTHGFKSNNTHRTAHEGEETAHEFAEEKRRKNRPDAAKFLEKAFRNALKKGYSPKELSQLLKNESIIIPAYLIQKFLSETADSADVAPAQKKEIPPQKPPAPARASF
ncbi:hypothetical protein, partial [Desulfovibrio sp. ZJ200]|uniref:hypothetical protein n=1 Tax=Desulfovibrio sp. ZJ200 TaxID=2709792 RepID=UPI0013EBD941